jgi:hypothetical protein
VNSQTVEELILSSRGAEYITDCLYGYGILKKMVDNRKAAKNIARNLIRIIPEEIRQKELYKDGCKDYSQIDRPLETLRKITFEQILVSMGLADGLPDRKEDFAAWWNWLSCMIHPILRDLDSDARRKIDGDKEAKEKLCQVAFLASFSELYAHI